MSERNISLVGDGCITSGNYQSVRVVGQGKVMGYIEADKMSVTGDLTSEDDMKIGDLSVTGDAKFKNMDAQNISIVGTAKFNGNINTVQLKITGTTEISNRVKAKAVKIAGIMSAKATESEDFYSNGAFEIDSLNANDIRVKLRGRCEAQELGGETIEVWYPAIKKMFVDFLDMILFRKTKRHELHADTIEADSIHLEYTVANSVKGNSITIGPGCKIKTVEYKDKVYIDNGSRVEKTVKI